MTGFPILGAWCTTCHHAVSNSNKRRVPLVPLNSLKAGKHRVPPCPTCLAESCSRWDRLASSWRSVYSSNKHRVPIISLISAKAVVGGTGRPVLGDQCPTQKEKKQQQQKSTEFRLVPPMAPKGVLGAAGWPASGSHCRLGNQASTEFRLVPPTALREP